MRRYIITLVLSLWIAQLFGDNRVSDTLQNVCFPVIETPVWYTSTVHGKDYLVFIERSDSLNIKGHYMSLGAKTDTLPFQMEAQGANVMLYYNGIKDILQPHIVTMDSQQGKGYAQSSVLDSVIFRYKAHKAPTFHDFENNRYQDTLFAVEEISDIPYANVRGFWSTLSEKTDATEKIQQMGNALSEIPLELRLNVFRPHDDTLQKHPMVMLIHGGAFYFGSKDNPSITRWCRHLASKGYVAVSIDYRMGFIPTLPSIGRAGYRAIQDAHAAMRFMVAHQEEYGIDTSMMFVGGASAGAITSLNLAFMTNETRPEYSRGGFLRPELGDIDICGNNIRTVFHIKGIVDMWGAMPDTSMLHNHDIPILAFHGDADDIVPYGHDHPFGAAGGLKTLLTEKMFGSSCIVDRAIKLGHKAELVTFSGYKHSPHLNPETKELNENFYIIQDKMSEFFYDIIMPEKLEIIEKGSSYSLYPKPVATSWQVEGGIILSEKENHVKVQWFKNAPKRSITASAILPYGLGIKTTKTLD